MLNKKQKYYGKNSFGEIRFKPDPDDYSATEEKRIGWTKIVLDRTLDQKVWRLERHQHSQTNTKEEVTQKTHSRNNCFQKCELVLESRQVWDYNDL